MASEDHFERLTGLLQGQNVFCGGGWNASALKLEPTIVSRPKMDSPLMAEPIYGPILSVLPYGAMQEAVQMMRTLPAPYALYCFTTDIRAGRRLMRDLPFGVGCLNDCGMQALSPKAVWAAIEDVKVFCAFPAPKASILPPTWTLSYATHRAEGT